MDLNQGFLDGATRYISTKSDSLVINPFDSGIEIAGNGVRARDKVMLAKWAKRKLITQSMILKLVDVANKKGKPERAQSYWNTYHCLEHFYASNGRLHGKYCKNRICTLCCSIRKAEIINKYFPIMNQWEDPHFVTLTGKSIPAKELGRYIDGFIMLFQKIIDKHRKRHQRGKSIALKGVRSIESNFNPAKRTYNPHFHITVAEREMAEIIVDEWLSRFNERHAASWCQKIIKVDSIEKNLIEIIKYGSKIFTEVDLHKKANSKTTPYVYVSALDNILTAMSGHRIFERFGFNLPAAQRTSFKQNITQFDEWMYDPGLRDWQNVNSASVLSEYEPSPHLEDILLNRINTSIE